MQLANDGSASPELSVIMPVSEVAPWLDECLSSILSDQHVALELVAVDDHSTDGSRQILERWAALDDRLRIVDNPGRGGAEARNEGLRIARGAFVAFADADDLVPRDAYRTLLDQIRSSGSSLVVGSFLKFFSDRTWRPTSSWPAFREPRVGVTLSDQPSLLQNRACWNRIFRREFLLGADVVFPSVPRSNDIVPMVTALTAAESIDVVTDVVYLYRARPGATSMTARKSAVDSFMSYIDQELASTMLTSALGDAGVDAVQAELVLRTDGWVHLCGMLNALDLDHVGSKLLADVRHKVVELHHVVMPSLGAPLPPEVELVYAAVGRGDWALAVDGARLATVSAATLGARLSEVLQLLAERQHQLPRPAWEALAATGLVRPLAGLERAIVPVGPDLEQIVETLLDHAGDLTTWWAPQERDALPIAVRLLLEALDASDRSRVTALMEAAPPRVTFRGVAVVDGEVRILLRTRRCEPEFEIVTAAGPTRLETRGREAGSVEVALPRRWLGRGELRASIDLPDPISVPVRFYPSHGTEAGAAGSTVRATVATGLYDGVRIEAEPWGLHHRLAARLRRRR